MPSAPRTRYRLKTTIGLVLCTAASAATALATHASSERTVVPLAFTVVIVVLAVMYGMAVGIVGALISAAVFAHVLFAPRGSLAVEDAMARGNIAWMMAASVALSFLFATPKER